MSVADILGATAEAGEVRCSLGYADTGHGIGEATIWGPWGFISRPPAPGADDEGAQTAARALYTQDGQQKRVLGVKDSRLNARVGELQPGDSAIVCLRDARVFVKNESNSVTLYTVSQPDDLSMAVTLDGSTGTATVLAGGAFVELVNDRITLAVNGGGSLIIDKNGVTINGNVFKANTTEVRLGMAASAMPPGLGLVALGVDALAGPAAVPSLTVFRSA